MSQGSHWGGGCPTHLFPTSSSLRIDGSPTQTFHKAISDTLMPLIYECHTISKNQVQSWLPTRVPTPPAVSGRSTGGWEEAAIGLLLECGPCGANRDWEGYMTGRRVSGHQSMSASARIKTSCLCLRAWLSQHQNRKRERLGDSQGLGLPFLEGQSVKP